MLLIRTGVLCLALIAAVPSAVAQSSQPNSQKPVDGSKLVQLAGIEVNGSHLPTESIVRLSGLKVGQQVDYKILSEACRRITSTGLVKAVDYAYNVVPGRPGVVVSLQVFDEQPQLPAKIVPAEDASILWSCLTSADPIFASSLPNTKDAMSFYAANIDRCLTNMGRGDAEAIASVACDVHGKAAQIIFDIRPKGRVRAAR